MNKPLSKGKRTEMKISLNLGLVLISLFTSMTCAWSQSAVFETPIISEQGKPWWETDRDAYRDFIDVSEEPADVRLDGLSPTSTNITVHPNQIVELDFPEMYDLDRSKDRWTLVSKTGAKVGFIVVDFHVRFDHGRALIHEPGTRLWKFKARESGDIVLTFKHGPVVLPSLTSEIPGDIKITIHVQ